MNVHPLIMNNPRPVYDREPLNIFAYYMSRSEEQKNLIFMPTLLMEYLRNIGGAGEPQIVDELS